MFLRIISLKLSHMKAIQPLRFSYTGSIAKLFMMACLITVNQLYAQTVIEKIVQEETNNSQLQIHITKALGPLLFSLLVSIVIIIINKKNRLNAAIGATALLFGMIHAFAWPSPVGLTLLGIGLGMAYAKTGNIITPIFIHMGFNCLAFGMLLLQTTKA